MTRRCSACRGELGPMDDQGFARCESCGKNQQVGRPRSRPADTSHAPLAGQPSTGSSAAITPEDLGDLGLAPLPPIPDLASFAPAPLPPVPDLDWPAPPPPIDPPPPVPPPPPLPDIAAVELPEASDDAASPPDLIPAPPVPFDREAEDERAFGREGEEAGDPRAEEEAAEARAEAPAVQRDRGPSSSTPPPLPPIPPVPPVPPFHGTDEPVDEGDASEALPGWAAPAWPTPGDRLPRPVPPPAGPGGGPAPGWYGQPPPRRPGPPPGSVPNPYARSRSWGPPVGRPGPNRGGATKWGADNSMLRLIGFVLVLIVFMSAVRTCASSPSSLGRPRLPTTDDLGERTVSGPGSGSVSGYEIPTTIRSTGPVAPGGSGPEISPADVALRDLYYRQVLAAVPAAEDGADPDLIVSALGDSLDGEGIMRVGHDGDRPVVRWATTTLGQPTDILVGRDVVFFDEATGYVGLDLTTGRLLWRSRVDVDGGEVACGSCMHLLGTDDLLVATDDAVTAYHGRSGVQAWTRRYPAEGPLVATLSDRVAITDVYRRRGGRIDIDYLSARSGAKVSTSTVTCSSNAATYGVGMLRIPATDDVLVSSYGARATCVARLDRAGHVRWTSPTPLQNEQLSHALVTDEVLVVPDRGQLAIVSLADGKVAQTAQPLPSPGSELVPRAVTHGLVLAEVQVVVSGSHHVRLVGIDGRTGTARWTRDSSQEADPIRGRTDHPESSGGRSFVGLLGGGSRATGGAWDAAYEIEVSGTGSLRTTLLDPATGERRSTEQRASYVFGPSTGGSDDDPSRFDAGGATVVAGSASLVVLPGRGQAYVIGG